MQYVDNGMYALALSEGADSIPVDEVCSDDDNEVLGAVSADGMPLTRDDTLVVDKRASGTGEDVIDKDTGEDVVDKNQLETVKHAREANNGKVVDDNYNDDDHDKGLVE